MKSARMRSLGVHRSLDPVGVLPWQAKVVDARSDLVGDEMAVAVDCLHIDAASWAQLKARALGDEAALAKKILEIVAERGKMHNPVTGSGGIFVGEVAELGPDRLEPPLGTRIASLVSLAVTPLALDMVDWLELDSNRVKVKGRAILSGFSTWAELPRDIDEKVALRVLDVCGAPAWMAKLARPGMKIAVIGAGGKSGMLACAQGVKSGGRVLGLCWPQETVAGARDAGAEAIAVDGTDPIAVADATEGTFGGPADLVFVCSSAPGCEGGAIISCANDGRVVFFSMATSLPAAALIAEALAKTCELTIGNGYIPGHAEFALELIRSEPRLMERFSWTRLY